MDNDFSRYVLTADYHTHTRYSKGLVCYYHGKGTILENVKAATNRGLSEIAITDHGPGHMFYGLSMEAVPQMRRDVQEAKKQFPDMKIELGVEANIIHSQNGLDVKRSDISKFDFINAGYHHGVPKGDMIRNPICSYGVYPSGSRTKLMAWNTEMVIQAIYENPVRILTHPGDKGPFDVVALAKACQNRGTLLEINNRHNHLTEEEIRKTMEYDVSYVIDSDAHRPEEVGTYESALRRALQAGLPISRIVNVEERYEITTDI